MDHHYLKRPFTQYQVDSSNEVNKEKAAKIEQETRGQANCRIWHDERKFRLTASHFGEIIHSTAARDYFKFCTSLYSPKFFSSAAVVHGRTYEKAALEKFSEQSGKKLLPCGLFIHEEFPFLAATPDARVDGENSVVEVKCPFSIKDEIISSGNLPYLHDDGDGMKLKRNHQYYYQIIGQLVLSRSEKCYFVIFTFKDMYVEEIGVDFDFFSSQMLPKLKNFYNNYYRQHIEEQAILQAKRD